MVNEGIFILSALLDLAVILLAFRFGKNAVIATIVVNIILVTTFGAKLIPIFGFVTNVGNVFYASIFLAVNMLVEHYGKKEGFLAVLIGFFSLILFLVMSQFVVYSIGVDDVRTVNQAITTLFQVAPRVALASMLAYLVVQNLNVWLYDSFRIKDGGRRLWYRNIFSTSVAQGIDSVLFFTIAFYGIIPMNILFQTILIGFLLKAFIAVISTPFLYASLARKREEILLA